MKFKFLTIAAAALREHLAEDGELIFGTYSGRDTGRGMIGDVDPATWQNSRWPREFVPGQILPAVVTGVDAGAIAIRIADARGTIDAQGYRWTRRQPADLVRPGDVIEARIASVEAETGHLTAELEQPPAVQGALVAIENSTGQILAMVGGTDYVASNYNRATEAVRQPGSAWKLFVYLAALEAGYTPDDMVKDTPVRIANWSPRNSSGRNVGDVDLRTAFAYSINTVAAQLGNEVGFSTVAAMARRFGITTPISTYPSMVLGSSEVRLIDMTRAFASVAARGQSLEPHGILKVESADGRLLYSHKPASSYPLVPDYVAAGITDLLQTAVNTGTGRAAQIGRPVAGKTGTTSSNKDGYFVGFSSGVTTGVWMGRDDAGRVGGLQGGAAPARAFAAYMRFAVKDRPVEEFDTDLKLPQWQLEPDDEYLYGDPDEWYFIDEQGNLIEPRGSEGGDPLEPDEGGSTIQMVPPRLVPEPRQQPPSAASDDFLERATGGELPADPPPPRRQQPPPIQPPPRPTGPGQAQ